MFKSLVSFVLNIVGVAKDKVELNDSNNELRTRQFNFKITPTLYNKISIASKKIGKSKSEIANAAISEFLERI